MGDRGPAEQLIQHQDKDAMQTGDNKFAEHCTTDLIDGIVADDQGRHLFRGMQDQTVGQLDINPDSCGD